MKKYENILYDKSGNGVATVTLNRPEKLNTLSLELLRELREAMTDATSDKAVRVVIITGKGRAFCAGADLKSVNERSGPEGLDKEAEQEFHETANAAFDTIENCPKPIIAAVNGYALAGGFEICLWSDIVIASEDARIGDAHANYMLMGPISVNLAPRQIGLKKSMELLLTGDMWPAVELEKIGLVNKVVPADKLMEAANEMATKIAEKSPLGSKYVKSIVKQAIDSPQSVVHDLAFSILDLIALSKDRAEGARAFAEKRKPQYTGE
ncbi:MAG TPA: enoyl-CoA hydratase/isomerase family protein [Dehalococcoidia bacterium]|nr:enoyl-CoA hydratase/isomerase family protein [Dehalococcoidia bacterium]